MCLNVTAAAVVVPAASYLDFNLALVVLYVLYVAATITAWWVVHRGRPHLEKRSFLLMAIGGVSGIIEFILVPVREYIGPEHFSCDAYLWLGLMLILFIIGPYTLQLALFKYKADFNKHVGSLDNAVLVSVFKHVNIAEINQKRRTTYVQTGLTALARKRQSTGRVNGSDQTPNSQSSQLSVGAITDIQSVTNAEGIIDAKHKSSDRNAARMVLFRMALPALVIGVAITASFPDVYGQGCTGCSTSTVELAIIVLEVIYMIALGAYFGYKTRRLADPWGILRGTRNALLFGFIVGLIGLGLVTLDPMQLYATKQFSWGWIVCAAIGGMHTIFCVVPLWHSKDKVAITAVTRAEFQGKLQIAEFHQAFRAFSIGLFTIENITCWDFCQVLLRAKTLDMTLKPMLNAAFIADSAPMQVNLSDVARAKYFELSGGEDGLLSVDDATWRKGLELVADELLKLMHSDTLPKFMNTKEGKAVVLAVV